MYKTIEPALARCEEKGTDASYGKCVLSTVRGYAPLQVEQTPIVQGFVSKGSELVTEDITGGVIEGSGLRSKPLRCMPSKKSNPISPCRVELEFPSPEDIERYNLPPGTPAAIRKCDAKKSDGYLVPVSNLDDALAVSKDFCDCTKGLASRRKKCARHS